MDSKMEWIQEHRRQLMTGFAVVAVIVLIIGLCLSWFVYNKSLSTVGLVREPAKLKLMGPNATTIEQIDLRYDRDKDVDKETGIVTLKKPFCVKSNQSNTRYALYFARTTNINNLEIDLYSAEDVGSSGTAYVNGMAGSKSYSWAIDETLIDKNKPVKGRYVNKNKLSDALKADRNYDSQTFESFRDIDWSSSPVYWKLGDLNTDDDSVDNYILELSWPETQKETDVLYLIATEG